MKVLIIGTGLGGPALALALKQHGISCKIFDLRDQSAFEGGFVALAPNALRALDRIGMYGRISQQGWNYEEFQFLSSRNLSRIATVLNGSQEKYGYKALRVSRGLVRQTLIQALHEQDIELHFDSKCVEIIETDHSTVIAKFADGQEEEADFLIGADGIHSRVRKYFAPDANPTYTGLFGVGGSLAKDKLPQPGRDMYMPSMILGKLNSFAFMPSTYTGDRIGFFATVESNQERSREQWTELQSDKKALYEILQSYVRREKWPEVVGAACRDVDVDSISLWPFYKVPELTSWSNPSGRVIVVGDAAHAMPPTGGQGAAMAFEDAVTLADTLARLQNDNAKKNSNESTTSSAETTAAAIAQWQTIRQQRVKDILRFTSKGGDMRRASTSTSTQILKEWIMWAFFLWKGPDAGISWIYSYDTTKIGL